MSSTDNMRNDIYSSTEELFDVKTIEDRRGLNKNIEEFLDFIHVVSQRRKFEVK
ncbi:hypothetical protein [Metabacillus fastidiosus]|uniref:hypothetical protein n=1 Tax=Metabacillus fastidiosus TaxID=1458 RepID=UPI003D2AB1FA